MRCGVAPELQGAPPQKWKVVGRDCPCACTLQGAPSSLVTPLVSWGLDLLHFLSSLSRFPDTGLCSPEPVEVCILLAFEVSRVERDGQGVKLLVTFPRDMD